jgi:hypothetical protein
VFFNSHIIFSIILEEAASAAALHISIWCEWLEISPWLSRGMYCAMMARISESM